MPVTDVNSLMILNLRGVFANTFIPSVIGILSVPFPVDVLVPLAPFKFGGFAPEKTSSLTSRKSPSLLKSINPLKSWPLYQVVSSKL